MPTIRPFRALRYDPETVGDLSLVVSPPYDVIGPAELTTLLDRHPRNIVRLDLPTEQRGDEPDERYRRVARTFAAWRSDGTFHRDRRASLYVYEQAYRVPGTDVERVQRGFFGRLHLEPFGPGSGVLPHERTLAGPREDRYRLIRAAGANFSPVVGLYRDASGRAARLLDAVSGGLGDGDVARQPVAEVTDDEGTVHRLWAVAEVEPGADDPDAGLVARLAEAAGAGPITIADGHHRYETALRYRDERRSPVSGDEDEPFDFILMLLLEEGQPLTVLPTHRVISGLGDDGAAALLGGGPAALFDIRPAGRAEIEAAFGMAALAPGGRGRMAVWTRAGGAFLEARRAAFEPHLPAGGEALRRLDVVLLQAALEHLAGIDPAAVAAGRLAYTKSAAEALAWVDAGEAGADAAFLLEPTPIADISAVAAAGDVMPQKSTYFYPKALSGLVVNPHEW